MSNKYIFLLSFLLLSFASSSYGIESLLYLESQMVAGYSSLRDKTIFYSMSQNQAMQKPSIGIDYLGKVSSDYGDWGQISFQGRFAHDDTYDNRIETQIFNAYLKYKFPFADAWVGHNRPAYGLNSILDTHGYLLQTLTDEGFNFDYDWGAGMYTFFDQWDINISFTSGSGYVLYTQGNYLLSARLSYGRLETDNYTIGFSFSNGQIFDMVDYYRVSNVLYPTTTGSVDFSWNINHIELKCESTIGNEGAYFINGTLVRLGYNVLKENRLKLELQPVLTRTIDFAEDYRVYVGVSYSLTQYLALRGMYVYNHLTNDHAVIGQAYFYRKV